MDELRGFAFFCEDFRQEAASKTSYMGVIGPHLTVDSIAGGFPDHASLRLAKLVAVCMAYVPTVNPEIEFHAELILENAPEGVPTRFEHTAVISLGQKYPESLAQFNAQLPGFPVQDGMKISANFTVLEHTFSATMTIDFEENLIGP